VAPLVELLSDKDRDSRSRREAIDALGWLGVDALSAVPTLIEALQEDNDYIRQGAADALGAIGPLAKDAIPALAEMLNEENPPRGYKGILIQAGAQALAEIGPDSIDTLRGALRKDDPYVRGWAAFGLGEIGPAAAAAVPDLVKASGDTDKNAQYQAERALRRIRGIEP